MSRGILSTIPVLSLLVVMLIVPSVAFAAMNTSCTILSWTPNYPSQVNPGDAVQVASTINIACAQWRTFYSARLDLVDKRSGRIFSTSTFQIGWNPNYTTTVSNSATAPQASGPWQLQLNLYVFEEAGMVGSFRNPVNINVGTSALNTTTTQQTSAYSTSTLQQETASAAPPRVLQTTATANSPSQTVPPILYVAIAFAIILVIGSAIFLKVRKKPS